MEGGLGNDTFVFDSLIGSDTVTDFKSTPDTFRFSQTGIKIGDGDLQVEGGSTRSAAGGFSNQAELVIFTADIAGAVSATKAAAAIGSANSPFASGINRLFVVDNGTQTGIYLFQSSSADALVSPSELTLIALANTASTVLADYTFVT
jgi:hypothetical protein